jgi:hypothetical protein
MCIIVGRYGHASVVYAYGEVIVISGGKGSTGLFRSDVWKTVNGGTTWSLMTVDAEWRG